MQKIIETIRQEFPKKRIVIVGDLVADQFLHGTIDRVSREAPVFILRHERTVTLAGGAANAAVNVASLGGKVSVVGLVGKDKNGEELISCLEKAKVDCSGVLALDDFQTTTKVRILASRSYAARQQVLRIDYEDDKVRDSEEIRRNLIENFLKVSQEADAVVISDYNYGVASTEMINVTRDFTMRKKIPLLADSRHKLREFVGVTSATPNQEEVEELLGKKLSDDELVFHCVHLREVLNTEALLVTRGNKGMLLVEKEKSPLFLEAVGAKEPVDVTGAGDTVMATYALSLASGLNFSQSAFVSNHAGGIVVMKKGTASVTAEELIESLLRQELREESYGLIEAKPGSF